MSLPVCRAPGCGGALTSLLEAGEHPVSNGYVRQGEVSILRALTLCQCASCGLLQLAAGTFSEAELAASVPDWVRYNEPEAHLDEVAGLLSSLMAGDCGRKVAGLTYIDQSLLERLKKSGWECQTAVDVSNGADPASRCSIETMLAGVQSGQWLHGEQKVDLLIARQVFDHTRDMAAFIRFLHSCLTKDGMIVLEVPSSIPDMEGQNPLMLWESHANYFTPRTLRVTLESAGLKVLAYRQYQSGGPPALVAVCSAAGNAAAHEEWMDADVSKDGPKAYVERFLPNREKLQQSVRALRERHTMVAMLGAGHIGNLFLNLHALGRFLDCAVDDDPCKSGLFLPGSCLPIHAGATLAGVDNLFVLMAVNPATEECVIERWRQQNPSAVFGSIFPRSPRSVLCI